MWPTPTPIAVATPQYLSSFDTQAFGQSIGTNLVGGFNFFDAQPIAGIVWFVLLALIIIMGLLSIKTHLENL